MKGACEVCGELSDEARRADRRFVDARGHPTTVSTEEARLLASLKRLDVHMYTAVARWAQDDGAAAAAQLPPGRRTHEEDALRRSIAALDQQLAALQVRVWCRRVYVLKAARRAAGCV